MEIPTLPILIVIHAVSALLMAWPFYGTIITGERMRLGPPVDRADTYMENIIRQQSYRCVVYQVTMFVTGAWIVFLRVGGDWQAIYTANFLLLAKVLLVVLLVGMNTYMVFYLQPRIDKYLGTAKNSEDDSKQLGKYRGRRRWMAAVCLWYVLMAVILGVQVWDSFGQMFILVAAAIAGLFVLRAYKGLSPYGFF
jgi:hypothetical protein